MLALGRGGAGASPAAPSTYAVAGRTAVVLDPSGVVKGWAVERAAAAAARAADTDFCLSAGGDLVCHVADPDAPAVADRHRGPARPARVVAVVPVRTGAVATSGPAHRGAHLVDARTGRAADGVASVTVVGDDLTWADIDATAAFALGATPPRGWRTRPGRTGLVVWADGRVDTYGAR